jgi:hypothetical protein
MTPWAERWRLSEICCLYLPDDINYVEYLSWMIVYCTSRSYWSDIQTFIEDNMRGDFDILEVLDCSMARWLLNSNEKHWVDGTAQDAYIRAAEALKSKGCRVDLWNRWPIR